MIHIKADPKTGTVTMHVDDEGMMTLRQAIAQLQPAHQVAVGDPASLIIRHTDYHV